MKFELYRACNGCGSNWSDAQLIAERERDPRIIACCPERKMIDAGTALFGRTLAFDHGDQERNDLMRKVWSVTPWMVDAYTGSIAEERVRAMLCWCHEAFGDQASPIHDKAGRWQCGGATIYGWTWFGFSTREELEQFIARWPTPPGIVHPGGQ